MNPFRMLAVVAGGILFIANAPVSAAPVPGDAAVHLPSAAPKRALQLTDIHRVLEVSQPALTKNGERLAYVLAHHNLELDITQSRIWQVNYDGTQRRPLNAVPADAKAESQRAPAWGPDDAVYYLSDRNSEGEQVWRQPPGGGEPTQVTRMPAGVTDFALSPDGKYIAVIADDPAPTWPVGPGATTEAPLVTERFQFMDGDDGVYLDARRHHLHVVDVATAEARQLVQGAHDEWLPAWSPDGVWLAYVSKRGTDPDRHSNFDLFMIAADGKDVERQITDFPGADLDPYWGARPQWSPDGARILYLRGGEPKWTAYAPAELAIVDVRTGGVSVPARADRFHYNPRWAPDGTAILALREDAEATGLIRADLASGAVESLSKGTRFDTAFEIAANGRMTLLGGDSRAPAELFAVEPALRPLSRANDAWVEEVMPAALEDMRVTTADGTEVHGLLLRPAGYVEGRSYPTVVRLHGGPVYQFSHEFLFDMHWFAAQGYAVLAVNPRGSSGRGLDFAKAIYADWGNLDVKDVLSMVDALVARGIADPKRLVVGGHSYGSILANYVIASDARFQAAFSSSGGNNSVTLYGVDMYAREYEAELGTPWANLETYLRISYPFFKADRIKTPTLFLCGGNDFNVPCAGAQQMYQALRSLNVPTRLVRFPNQGHTLSIPSYLEFRLKSYLEWFDRYVIR